MGRHTDPTAVSRRAAVLTLTASVLLVAAGVAVLVSSGGTGWPVHPPASTPSVPPSTGEPAPARTGPADQVTAVPTATPRTPRIVVTPAGVREGGIPGRVDRQPTAPSSPRFRPAPRTTSGGSGGARVAEQVVQLVNLERARVGCGALATNATLQRVAQAHSDDLAQHGRLSRDGSDGESFVARIRAAGYHGGPVAENVAAGPSTARAVMKGWMANATERDNILDCRFTAVGIGLASGSTRLYWTQDFGG